MALQGDRIVVLTTEAVERPDSGAAGALLASLRAAGGERRTRAVILRLGSGTEQGQRLSPMGVQEAEMLATLCQICEEITALRKPVIAAAQGAVDGWQLTLCCCCDLVVAGRNTVFGGSGMTPDASCGVWTYCLPPRIAKWIAFGAGGITAEEATFTGLVNDVVADELVDLRVHELAAAVGRVPLDIMGVKKRSNNVNLELEGFRAALRLAADYSALALAFSRR